MIKHRLPFPTLDGKRQIPVEAGALRAALPESAVASGDTGSTLLGAPSPPTALASAAPSEEAAPLPPSLLTAASSLTATGSAPDTLTLTVSEDAWQGNAEFSISVDGESLADNVTVTALHNTGNWEPITFNGTFGAGPHSVAVTFVNDAYGGSSSTDRNLYLKSISLDGAITATPASLFSNGTVSFTVTGPSPSAGNDTGGASGRGGSMLPAGYLHTSGSQIVDQNGNPVRIAAIGWAGTDSLVFAPYGLWQSSLQQNIDAIKAAGFNTVRIAWTDLLLHASPLFSATYASINYTLNPDLKGLNSLQVLDALVSDAGKDGLKVIFDHHDNDGGPGGWGGQQANGLWFDEGPGSDGTDGSGHPGTVTAARFLADSVQLSQRYAGNSTVIGFDVDNEPTSAGKINWAQGGPTDIEAMYTAVGNAIQKVDPGALIIAEGPEEWSGPAPGMPAGFAEGDLSGVATKPVTLAAPNKVVYSVHEYPPDLSGNGSYTPAQQVAAMNAGWGYLEAGKIAPVWVGEMGSNMTSAQDKAWMQTVLDYMSGKDGAQGGPTFGGNLQPVSGSWWQWGAAPGQDPDGLETAWSSGTYNTPQLVASDQLLYKPSGAAASVSTTPATAPTPGASFLAPTAGTVTLDGAATSPVPGGNVIATILNGGVASTNGWAVELDTSDILSSFVGGIVTHPQEGVYVVRSEASDAALAAKGYVSFAFRTDSPGASPTIAAHLTT